MNNTSKGDSIMNQSANNKKLLDFLLYSYFGCKADELEKEGKKKCAYRAYLDLARTVKYVYSSKILEKAKRGTVEHAFIDIRKDRINDICSKLIESIKTYPNGYDNFNSWHNNECEEIKNEMNKPYDGDKKLLKKDFAFGQAQKWVNMTLKYLWLLDMLPEGLTAKSLHVPIDSFILEKLQEENVDGISGNDRDTYKYKGKSWSQIDDYNAYLAIQKEIRRIAKEQGISPIQWEGSAWMNIAENRSNKK